MDLENTFYKMCIIFMETFTKTVVVHHGLRQLNKVKYPTNQESTDYLLILQTNSKTLLQIIPAQIIDENDSFHINHSFFGHLPSSFERAERSTLK